MQAIRRLSGEHCLLAECDLSSYGEIAASWFEGAPRNDVLVGRERHSSLNKKADPMGPPMK